MCRPRAESRPSLWWKAMARARRFRRDVTRRRARAHRKAPCSTRNCPRQVHTLQKMPMPLTFAFAWYCRKLIRPVHVSGVFSVV